jgi:hypothetical protein
MHRGKKKLPAFPFERGEQDCSHFASGVAKATVVVVAMQNRKYQQRGSRYP